MSEYMPVLYEASTTAVQLLFNEPFLLGFPGQAWFHLTVVEAEILQAGALPVTQPTA